MTESEVRQIAEALVAQEDMRGYQATFAQANLGRSQADLWSVIFDVSTPTGRVLDTPMIVMVHNVTGEASFFPTL